MRIRPNTIATGNHVWNNFETLVVLTIGSISHLLNEARVITKRCVCKFKKKLPYCTKSQNISLVIFSQFMCTRFSST